MNTRIALILSLALLLTGCGTVGQSSVETSSIEEEITYSLPAIPTPPEYGYPNLDTENPYFNLTHLTAEVGENLTQYETFVEFPEENLWLVVLTPKSTLTDFSVHEVTFNEESQSLEKGEELYTIKEFLTEKPLILDWYNPGTIPGRGLTFTNNEGQEMTYFLSESGMDGTLLLLAE